LTVSTSKKIIKDTIGYRNLDKNIVSFIKKSWQNLLTATISQEPFHLRELVNVSLLLWAGDNFSDQEGQAEIAKISKLVQ
jgi:hypothetical protein